MAMIGLEFINLASKFELTTYAGLEDFADKFNFLFTVTILLICTAVVTVKQYILKPISCYISTEIGGSNLLNYVENYCWVQGTIPVSYNGKIPNNDAEWEKLDRTKILYYQWVPFVLGLQCILFYMPHVLWQIVCSNRDGTNLEHLVKKSVEILHANVAEQEARIMDIVMNVEYILFHQQRRLMLRSNSRGYGNGSRDTTSCSKQPVKRFGSPLSRSRGTQITSYYLLIKLSYLVVAVGQIFLMHSFLGFKSNLSFGFMVMQNILNGHDWEMTLIFPRVGFCYAKMKNLGVSSNAVTAQCALPVNMLNEKIYMFLWYWIMLAIILTMFSLIVWLWRIFGCSKESNYIRKYIELSDQNSYDEAVATKFANLFLRHDGMFLLRMIRLNAGDVVTTGIVECLWERYLKRIEQKDRDPKTNVPLFAFEWKTNLEYGGNTDEQGGENSTSMPVPSAPLPSDFFDKKQNVV